MKTLRTLSPTWSIALCLGFMLSTGVCSTTLASEASNYINQSAVHIEQSDSLSIITLEVIDGEIEFSDDSPRQECKVFDADNIHHLARWLSRSLPCIESQLPKVPIPGGCFTILHRRLLL